MRRKGVLISSTQAEHGGLLMGTDQNDQNMNVEIRLFMSSLRSCANTKDLDLGSQIHADICNRELLAKNTRLMNMLVSMYAKCGALAKAQEVVDELSVRDVVSWNTLIAGYVQHGQGEQAITSYRRMQSEGFSPDAFTYACIFKACSIMGEAEIGKTIHEEVSSLGMLENDVVLGNAVVDMYAKCGLITKAQEVLDALPVRNVVTWTALITGYTQQEKGAEALGCYQQMQEEGISPNAITYACILKACGITRDANKGKQIHDELVNQGLLKKDVILGNALVDMYSKCSLLTIAREVLEELPVRDVISWSGLIAGYAEQGQGHKALGCFREMQREGVSPNAITYVCILKACGITLEVDMGEKIHDEIVRQGLLKNDVMLGTALVDMYAKCGTLERAQNVFKDLAVHDSTAWNALIAGYAQHGQGEEVLDCLEQMRTEGLSPDVVCWNVMIGGYAQRGLVEEALNCFQCMQWEGTSPDAITFVNVLNACSHSGLVDEGLMYFKSMVEKYGITPDKEHQTCMVDLFGRARHFEKAMRMIEKMPFLDYPPVWSALLGACQKWGNVKLGRLAFEHAVQLDESNVGPYILMANIYAAACMQENAQIIDSLQLRNAALESSRAAEYLNVRGCVY